MNDKYMEIVKKYTPNEDILKNALITFIGGGLMGFLSEVLRQSYIRWFNLPGKEAGIMVILTLIVIASFLTALGIFDTWVAKLKCALIIPITGFAHSLTAAAMEYKTEGLVLGIGSNIFKLAGSVILYGVVAAYFFSLLRLLIWGL